MVSVKGKPCPLRLNPLTNLTKIANQLWNSSLFFFKCGVSDDKL